MMRPPCWIFLCLTGAMLLGFGSNGCRPEPQAQPVDEKTTAPSAPATRAEKFADISTETTPPAVSRTAQKSTPKQVRAGASDRDLRSFDTAPSPPVARQSAVPLPATPSPRDLAEAEQE